VGGLSPRFSMSFMIDVVVESEIERVENLNGVLMVGLF